MDMATKCPLCGGEVEITQFHCLQCDSSVSGHFHNCSPAHLDEETLRFIKVFLYAEGSIKQVEKLLNCSYPKVKNLLKKAKVSLGVNDGDTIEIEDANEVLDMLNEGKITFEDAMDRINKKGGSV